VTTALAGEGPSELLVPTYVGCLETKKDALLLLEACFRGDLHHSFCGPRGVASAIRSGCIFIWEQDISAVQYWNDGLFWTPIDRDGDFWISDETTTDDGLRKKTLSVPALGRFHHIVSYYNPWDTINGTLEAPSQDLNLERMALRDELASQLTTQSASTNHFPHSILKVNHSS